MAYSFKGQKSIKKEIKRILCEELDEIEQHLQATSLRDKAIHESRKGFKRIRALLRLIRCDLGEKRFDKENVFYRDIARKLSAIRDAQALIEAWKELKAYAPEEISDEVFEQVNHYLIREKDKASRFILEEQNAMQDALEDIQSRKESATALPVSGNNFGVIEPGLRKVYKQGVKSFRLVKSIPSMDHVHDWRKRVKYLLHHIQLLNISWEGVMNTYASEIKQLSDYLGLWRDLELLYEQLESVEDMSSLLDLTLISSLVTSYQTKLLHSSVILGEKIYQEKSKVFTGRIRGYWQSSKEYNEKMVKINK